MRVDYIQCDISECGKKLTPEGFRGGVSVLDSEEGFYSSRLLFVDIDLCKKCFSFMLEGNFIFRRGIAGPLNEFYFDFKNGEENDG